MILDHFPVGPLGCNCVILGDEQTKEAIIVDPGAETEKIMEKLGTHGLTCKAILHTHAHFDHVGCTHEVQHQTQAPTMLHEGDLFLYENLQMQLDAFGMPFKAPKPVAIDRFLKDDDEVSAGTIGAGVLHTPGHTPGSLCFVVEGQTFDNEKRTLLLAGDTLFQGSVGRTDLWGGDGPQMMQSIEQKLLNLPEDTLVITGHGPTTTIGQEKKMNPFLAKGGMSFF